jgi:hypothetical protein
MIKLISSEECKDDSIHTQINRHNTAHKQSKGQKHIIISIDVEKGFDMIKVLKKLEMDETNLNMINL